MLLLWAIGILFGVCLLMSIFAARTPYEGVARQRQRIRWRKYLKIGMAAAGILLLILAVYWHTRIRQYTLNANRSSLVQDTRTVASDFEEAVEASMDELRSYADWNLWKEVMDRMGADAAEITPEVFEEVLAEVGGKSSFGELDIREEHIGGRGIAGIKNLIPMPDVGSFTIGEFGYEEGKLSEEGGFKILYYEKNRPVFYFYTPVISSDDGSFQALFSGESLAEPYLEPFLSDTSKIVFFCQPDGTVIAGPVVPSGEKLGESFLASGVVDQETADKIQSVFDGTAGSGLDELFDEGFFFQRLDFCDCVVVGYAYFKGSLIHITLQTICFAVFGFLYTAAAILFGRLAKRAERLREEAELRRW